MIKERYSKVRKEESFNPLYTDINSIYKTVGKDAPVEITSDEDKEYIGYKNGIRRKELLIGLQPITNTGVFVSEDLDDDNWGCYTKWRKETFNLFGDVNESVGFFPEKFDINPKVSITKGEQSDFLQKFNDIRDKAFKEIDILRYALASNQNGGGDVNLSSVAQSATVREYTTFETYKDVSNLLSGISVKIPFAYGQFGLFDAYEEVVKPVCALMSLYSPHKSKDSTGGVNLYNTPYPSDAYLTAQQFKGIYGTAFETVASAFINKEKEGEEQTQGSGQSFKSGNVDFLNTSLQTIEQIAISGLLKVLKDTGVESTKWKYTTFRYGNFKIGPCQIKTMKANFDFKHLDERGYPYKCELEIEALGMTTATNDTIIDAFLR